MKTFQKRTILLTCLIATLAGCETLPTNEGSKTTTVSQANAAKPSNNLITRSEVVATVKSKNVAVDLERQALEWGYKLTKQEKLAGLNLYLLTFDCPPGVDPKDASLELERLQPLQWPESGCESVAKIGIIDGGLSQKFIDQSSAKLHMKSFIDQPPSKTAIGHGTTIGSILTDPKRLKNVELYSAAVVSQNENGENFSSPTAILKALDWMLLNDVKVVNISLSGPPNTVLESALNVVAEKGLIIVAAVGNQGSQSAPQFPAAYNNVLSATAVDVEGGIFEKAVRGSHVDFSAPGVDVYVETHDQGKYISGTSIAAPFITAAIASSPSLIDSNNRDDVIRFFSNSTIDLGPKGKDSTFGFGLINAKHICKKS